MEATLPMIHHILVPTGFSDGELPSFRTALRMCLAHHARLTLLHVGPESENDVPWDRFPHVRKTLLEWGVIKEGEDVEESFARLNIHVEKRALRATDVTDGVQLYLERHKVDLIVMATEGRGFSQRFAQPSVADPIMGQSGVSALLLPAGKKEMLRSSDHQLDLRRIVLPIGPGIQLNRAVQWAIHMALRSQVDTVSITVLHVGKESGPLDQVDLPEHGRIKWERTLRTGPVLDTINQVAQEQDADLLVMATNGYDSLLDRMVGTRTERIIRAVKRPVLIVPAYRDR